MGLDLRSDLDVQPADRVRELLRHPRARRHRHIRDPGGIGYFRDPQRWLTPGDEVTVEVEGIGRLTNPVAAGWGRA